MINDSLLSTHRSQPLNTLEYKRVWEKRNTLFTGLALFGLGMAILLYVYNHFGSLYDDAYIYLRYVRNLYAGCGLRFNCADAPVEGFTGPLYLFSLILGRLLIHDLEVLVQIIGTFSLGGALLMLVMMARHPRWHRDHPMTPIFACMGLALLFGFNHHILLNAISGLETAMACMVVVFLLRAALRPQQKGLRFWLVLVVLLRPEAALFCVAAPLFPRARKVSFWIPIFFSAVGMVLLRALLFRDIVPNTYWAKSGGTWPHFFLGLEYIRDAVSSFPWILLAPLALLIPQSRRFVLYVLLVSVLWFGFFLRTGGDLFAYSRLALPVVLPLTMLGSVGLLALLERISQAVPMRATSAIFWISPVLVLVTVFWLWPTHTFPKTHGFDNVKRWKALGLYLKNHHAKKTIATVPIGAIGYFSELPLIDLVGLTAPAIAKAKQSVPPKLLSKNWIGHERHNTPWVIAQKPDIIVMSKWRLFPWKDLREARAGFFAEWLLLRQIKSGRIPYELRSVEILPGIHWLLFLRSHRALPRKP